MSHAFLNITQASQAQNQAPLNQMQISQILRKDVTNNSLKALKGQNVSTSSRGAYIILEPPHKLGSNVTLHV